MAKSLESILAALTVEHGIHYVQLGINTQQRELARFSASLQWDGYARSGIACAQATAPSLTAALCKAIDEMRADRQPIDPAAPDFADIVLEAA